ncbi:MAG: SPFH domain-containing protein [Anaerovoracaceae bacterium]
MRSDNSVSRIDIQEKELHPMNGMMMLIVCTLGLIASIACCVMYGATGIFVLLPVGIIGIIAFPICYAGLKVVNPNEALVLTLFGKYYGTIREHGFFFVNPFCTGFNPTAKSAVETESEEFLKPGKLKYSKSKNQSTSKKVSTKTMTLNNAQQKVNDVQGNPIIIGSVVIWRVASPTKAVFNVENYFDYLSTQCDSTIRNIARLFPYDSIEGDDTEMTLRGSSLEIAERMKVELQERTEDAGIEIMEVRITHLAYSEEIAAAMLKRQQAAATIAAREQIVEGAVGMVRMALDKLEADDLIVLDDERKAAMVSNLLVVLCGDREAQPVVNSGSIY